MFEFIRTHQRLMQFLLLLFIVPSFALVGIQSYSGFGDKENIIAKVAGQSITQQEWDSAQREQMARYQRMLGERFDSQLFDTPEVKRNLLEGLIVQRVLLAETNKKHLSIADTSLQQNILDNPSLANADGKFDYERYKSSLAAQGMTPTTYEAKLREDLILRQLNGAIQSTAFVPQTVLARLSDVLAQEREVQELTLKATDYASQVNISDAALQAYYKNNNVNFEVPEQIKAEYVVLNADAIAAQFNVTDQEVKTYYDQNLARYTPEEQRRARHILISVKKDAPATEKAVAKSKAQALLSQVRKNPADFAKLAKENSQDPGSAEQGGDLGFFGKGMMVPSFQDAVYKLKKDAISDLVESDFGIHIIQLTDIKPATAKPLDAVKTEVVEEIKKQKTAKKYTELAEIFTNTVYEQADSLKPVADKLQLKIELADHLTRQGNATAAPNAIFNNKKLLKALFSDEAIKNKRNTEAIEVSPNTLVAARIVEYKPTTKQPFEQVKSTVRDQLIQMEGSSLAQKAGVAKLAALKANTANTADTSGFSAAKMVGRSKAADLNDLALSAVMAADVSKLPAYVGVSIPSKGYSLYRINKIAQPTIEKARKEQEEEQMRTAYAQQDMLSYIDFLKQKAKVKILKPVSSITVTTISQDD